MSTPDNQNPATPVSNDVTVPTPVDAPKPNLSLKPTAPVVVAPAATIATAPVATAPIAAAPVAAAPKPKLNLNLAPRATGSDLNVGANAQKIPSRQYAATIEDDSQPSVITTLIAGIAAAAAITFAVLLFLKTK